MNNDDLKVVMVENNSNNNFNKEQIEICQGMILSCLHQFTKLKAGTVAVPPIMYAKAAIRQ